MTTSLMLRAKRMNYWGAFRRKPAKPGTNWSKKLKATKAMRSILYLIAVVLIIGWLLGFFVFSFGYLVHILLVFAVISILLSIIGSGARNKD